MTFVWIMGVFSTIEREFGTEVMTARGRFAEPPSALEMARACKRLIISTEEIIPTEDIRKYPDRTIIPYYLVDAVVHAPFASHPGEMAYVHGRDEAGVREWIEASQTAETAAAYMDKYIFGLPDHQAYLDLVGRERLETLVAERERRE